MLKGLSKRAILVSAIVVLLIAVVTVWVINYAQPEEADPDTVKTPSSSQGKDESPSEQDKNPDNSDTDGDDVKGDDGDKNANTEVPNLDPATVGNLDIEPLGVTIAYVKGVGGFEYEVRRTPSGTQYADFKSEELVGTKCTNDTGVFASILVSPKADEQSTLSKKVEVDGVTYGLSLASTACTSNIDLLKAHQDSFSEAFGLIKKIEQ